MEYLAKVGIRNRFDIECRDTLTGKVSKYHAHNIILNQMYTRLLAWDKYFTHIHFGTGVGTLDPARTQLFTPAGSKAVTSVSQVRALPTSRWMQQIQIMENEFVGKELTEVGIGYDSQSTTLVTHAMIKDSEGHTISIVKTDTMVITIYATVFFELGELTDMYQGRLRWVMPLANNELLSYLMDTERYPTQYFRVSAVPDFATEGGPEGCAPAYHGTSSSIIPASWSTSGKKCLTPVRRFGINDGNGEIRCFGLGTGPANGTLRGQLPIPGAYTGYQIEKEPLGTGDGIKKGFNPVWPNAQITAVYVDGDLVSANDYDLAPTKKGTNFFLLRDVQLLEGSITNLRGLTDGNTGGGNTDGTGTIGIDTGAVVSVGALKAYRRLSILTYTLYGCLNDDFSDANPVLIGTITSGGDVNKQIDFGPALYRYWKIIIAVDGSGTITTYQLQLLSAADQITFHTAPTGAITADYTVSYIPKDIDHVLDLQVGIQYGEQT